MVQKLALYKNPSIKMSLKFRMKYWKQAQLLKRLKKLLSKEVIVEYSRELSDFVSIVFTRQKKDHIDQSRRR